MDNFLGNPDLNYDENDINSPSGQINNNNFNQNSKLYLLSSNNLNIESQIKDEKIKNLEAKLNACKRALKEKTHKQINQDNLYVNFNSLNKSYAELEKLANKLKLENFQLSEIIHNKNETISKYEELFRDSQAKFRQLEKINASLKVKKEEFENKVRATPDLFKRNKELEEELTERESSIQALKEELNKREELLKLKLDNQEKLMKNHFANFEEEIKDLKFEVDKYKGQLEIMRDKNEALVNEKRKALENATKEVENKEKEIEKLNKRFEEVQEELCEKNIIVKNKSALESDFQKKKNNEINALNEEIREKEAQINKLNSAFEKCNSVIKQSENELISREQTIKALQEDKEMLLNQLQSKQSDFSEYKKSCRSEVEAIQKKLALAEKEKVFLSQDNNDKANLIAELNSELEQYHQNVQLRQEECKDVDKKYKELAEILQLKEQEFMSENNNLREINKQLENKVEVLSARYQGKIESLTLSNNELNARVKNLIHSLISLKDYAINLERNICDNNSNLLLNKTSSMVNLCDNQNKYDYDCSNRSMFNQNKYSKELLSGMKNMIDQIDSKILSNNELNQTF